MAVSKAMMAGRDNPSDNSWAVVLSDGDEKAVELIQSNLQNPNNLILTDRVKACVLKWWKNDVESTSIRDQFLCQQVLKSVESCNNDGKSQSTVGLIEEYLFNDIIAGDVLYKAELPELLFHTAYTLLKKEDGNSLWLCHVPRHGVTHEIVQQAAKDANFDYEIIPTNHIILPEEVCPIEDSSRAVVYKMTPRTLIQ